MSATSSSGSPPPPQLPKAPEPAPPPATTEDASLETARTAGRGGVAVLGAKLFFILVGFVQKPLLVFIIGLANYGGYSRVMAAANIVNNVIIQSSTQGVSRAVTRAKGAEPEALRAALRVHVPLAILLTALCAGIAPVYAIFENDASLTVPLVVLAGVVFLYGVYGPLIGYLNGRSLFVKQAALDVTFATIRTAALLGAGFLFVKSGASGVLGASVGFVLASACIVPLAARWTGFGKKGAPGDPRLPTARAYLGVLGGIAATQLCINLLMQVDTMVIGRFLSLGAEQTIPDGQSAKTVADSWAGVYNACQTFAFLPFQVLPSVTQILFPMVARAKAEGDAVALERYVRRGSRLAMIVCGLLVSVIATIPWSLLFLAFGNGSADKPLELAVADSGEATLRVLALGQAAFAMLGVAATVLNSIGKERTGSAITLAAVTLVVGGCWIVLPRVGFGAPQLLATALVVGGALVVALAVAAGAVVRNTGSFIPLATGGRVALAVGACAAGGVYLPHIGGRLGAPFLAIGVAAVYLVILVVTRELTGEDVATVKSMLGRKKARA